MAKILIRPRAEIDLYDIWDFSAKDSPSNATKFLRALDKKFENLAENPGLGIKRDELLKSLYSFPVKNYLIFYTPLEDGIEVVRVLQGSRDIEAIFSNMSNFFSE